MSSVVTVASVSVGRAALIFLGFAMAYFLSALLRAVTATLAPIFSSELGLRAADLGLLAGAYFFGFAVMQLPLGSALDRFGPRRVVSVLLVLAALGCVGFATAETLWSLIVARAIVGVGVAACLMAPLTCFRRVFSVHTQLRLNSWMLMTGSLGMVASTVPVQSLLPHWGWRGLFMGLAGCLAVSIGLILWLVPGDDTGRSSAGGERFSYWRIARDPTFRSLAPLGFVVYGGLIAVQSLWAGPWLTRVAGWTPGKAAEGLFGINCCMLIAFAIWGSVMPALARRGVTAGRLISAGLLCRPHHGGRDGADGFGLALGCLVCVDHRGDPESAGSGANVRPAGRRQGAFRLQSRHLFRCVCPAMGDRAGHRWFGGRWLAG